MQDPSITIMKHLKDNWTLTNDLAVGNIRFSTGWYDRKFEAPQVTVTLLWERDVVLGLGYTKHGVEAIYEINIWVKVLKGGTGKGPGLAKKWRWQIKQHIKDILKPSLEDLTDLKYTVLDQVGRAFVEPNETPPILRHSLPVYVEYEI